MFVWPDEYSQAPVAFFTLADARKLKPLDNVAKYPDAAILSAGAQASFALEHACGVWFIPRAFTETFVGNRRTELQLTVPRPKTLTTVTLNDVDIMASVTLTGAVLYRAAGFPYGTNITVTGTAGHLNPPSRVSRAALLLAKRYLVDSPVSDRTTSFTGPEGSTERYVTAGIGTAITDVPEANAVIQEYGIVPGALVG